MRAELTQFRLDKQLREEQTQAKEAGLIETKKASNEVAVNRIKEQDSRESAQTPEKSMAPDPSTAWKVVFDHHIPISRQELSENIRTYTTASLKRCVDDVPVLISNIHKKLEATVHLPYLNQTEQNNKKNLDDAMNRWQGVGSMCQHELTRRGSGGPVPKWYTGSTIYEVGPLSVVREYDVFTKTDYPPRSTSAGLMKYSQPLINEYRPTGYPPGPATKAQRQLGEIVIAEYPYWCSKCLRFGHMARWCEMWKKMPFLWFYAYVLESHLAPEDHCVTCLKGNKLEAARSHTTDKCGKLIPYDHPENWPITVLGLKSEEEEQLILPYPGKNAPSVLPRCLIFKIGDLAWIPEQKVNDTELGWDFAKFGFDRMLAGFINKKHKNKNDSISALNNATQVVWQRLTGKPQPLRLGTRTQLPNDGGTPDIGWGNIPKDKRAPCVCPDYVRNARDWWSEAFLADILRLLNPTEVANYEKQKSRWNAASDKSKGLQGETQRKPYSNIMINTRRNTWDHIFYNICQKEQYAVRIRACQQQGEGINDHDLTQKDWQLMC